MVVGGLLLVWILEAETVLSQVVMFGLVGVLAWQELARRRRTKRGRAHPGAGQDLKGFLAQAAVGAVADVEPDQLVAAAAGAQVIRAAR